MVNKSKKAQRETEEDLQAQLQAIVVSLVMHALDNFFFWPYSLPLQDQQTILKESIANANNDLQKLKVRMISQDIYTLTKTSENNLQYFAQDDLAAKKKECDKTRKDYQVAQNRHNRLQKRVSIFEALAALHENIGFRQTRARNWDI